MSEQQKSKSKNDLMLQSLNESRKHMKYPSRGKGTGGIYFDVMTRLHALDSLFVFGKAEGEVLRHIPVSAISALQSYWKGLVIDLVSIGEPYRSRGVELLDEKVRLRDVVEWFNNDSYTFAEVIAYSHTFNSISDLDSVANALFDFKFKNKVTELAASIPSDPIFGNGLPADIDVVYRSVGDAFKLRHLLAHEAAAGLELDAKEVRELLHSVLQLILAVEKVKEFTVWAKSDKSMSDLVIEQNELRENAAAHLETALKRATELVPTGEREWLQESHQKWNDFRQHWNAMSYGKLEGTLWPYVVVSEDIKMIEARIEEIRNWNGSIIGDDVEHPDHPVQREEESRRSKKQAR